MKQTELLTCLHCGRTLVGRQRQYCSDAHRKAHKRAQQKSTGAKLQQFADGKLSALSTEEYAELLQILDEFIKYERVMGNNPHSEAQGAAHNLLAELLEIVRGGLRL